MKHKVLGSVFVLALALGMFSVTARTPVKPVLPKSYQPVEKMLAEFRVKPSDLANALEHKDNLARPLASYRVRTAELPDGLSFKGATFDAKVTGDGFRFGSKDFAIELGGPVIRQGDTTIQTAKGKVSNPEHGVGEIDRGPVVERYVFENTRAEQIFTFAEPVGTGAMEVRIPVLSPLPGPVVAHNALKEGFKEAQFLKGGLAFTDAAGATQLAYHSAIALDSGGQQHVIVPRFENGEIVLPVPASFMDRAVYPVMVDPWFDLAGSGTGGGLTNNGSVSDRPALLVTGAGLAYICWADTSSATPTNSNNSDIYLLTWTGFRFVAFGASLDAGGISSNAGTSTNPSICISSSSGLPMVAWEDDTNGFVQIYMREFKDPGGWSELKGSATGGGVSVYIGPNQHPSIASLAALIPGTASAPAKIVGVPIVVWEDHSSPLSEIGCRVYYPGQPTTPPVPEGWYELTANGLGTSDQFLYNGTPSQLSVNGVSERPVVDIDLTGNPVVAWQETQDGNYEIYARRYLWNTGTFRVINGAAVGTFEISPPGNWVGISTSANAGGISNTAGLSQYPSLVVDGFGGISVAWQETLPGPPPGTSSQIYVRRSVAAGAWNEVPAGSASGLGISQSLGNATNPSIAAGGGYLAVAWSDTSNTNSEIYARRIPISPAVGAAWEQIGFQGSAFPQLVTDLTAPIDGLSKTSNLSLMPRIAVDAVGSPTVVWMDGSNASFDVLLKQFAPNAPGVVNGTDFSITLRQTLSDPTVPGAIDIASGDASQNSTVFLSSRVFTETLTPAGSALRIEVEVRQASAPLTGTPTASALIVAPDSPSATPGNLAVVPFAGLPNTAYRWQARTVDQVGRHSPWFQFPTAFGSAFRIDTAPPPGGGPSGPTPPTFVATTRSKGSCGLLGLEALLAIGLLRVIRRKR